MDDGRARREATCFREELDRAQPVFGNALVDLARLLVGVHVQRQVVRLRVRAELLEPVARAGAHGVGGDADTQAASTQRLELLEILGDRFLPESLDPAARVRDVEQHDLDLYLGSRLGCAERLLEPEVVELADGRVPRVTKFLIDRDIFVTHL
jgi:hypothetical protein